MPDGVPLLIIWSVADAKPLVMFMSHLFGTKGATVDLRAQQSVPVVHAKNGCGNVQGACGGGEGVFYGHFKIG